MCGRLLGMLAVGCLAVSTAACTDATSILVEVSSADLAVPDDVDRLQFRAHSAGGALIDKSFDVTGSWPHSLSIRPGDGRDGERVTIEVVASHTGALVVRRVVEADFVDGETRLVRVDLTRACVGIDCGELVDCRAGLCVGSEPADAGTPDAGAPDAGRDARVDAASDAGPDARTDDASMDATFDAQPADLGTADVRDLGPSDTGALDARPTDAGREAGARRFGLVINEVDYDQPSADTMEFIELLNAGDDEVALGALELVLINGSGGTAYATISLSGELSPGERVVVRMPAVVAPPGVATIDMPAGVSIQNGDPDGIALWNPTTRELIDALSYGGAITSARLGAATTVSLVEGAATPVRDSPTAVRSLVRIPDGADTDDALADWALSTMPTPGAPNVP